MVPVSNVAWDISTNSDAVLFWGCDPETTPWGFNGQMASRLSYWWTELGIKQVYIAPDCNYGNAVHADKWIPVLPNTDAALYLGVAHTWMVEGTYDKEYVKTHSVGFDKFEEYVLGKTDGVAKTARWAAEITGVPPTLSRRSPVTGRRRGCRWPSATAVPACAARTPLSRRGFRPACSPCRAWASPAGTR